MYPRTHSHEDTLPTLHSPRRQQKIPYNGIFSFNPFVQHLINCGRSIKSGGPVTRQLSIEKYPPSPELHRPPLNPTKKLLGYAPLGIRAPSSYVSINRSLVERAAIQPERKIEKSRDQIKEVDAHDTVVYASSRDIPPSTPPLHVTLAWCPQDLFDEGQESMSDMNSKLEPFDSCKAYGLRDNTWKAGTHQESRSRYPTLVQVKQQQAIGQTPPIYTTPSSASSSEKSPGTPRLLATSIVPKKHFPPPRVTSGVVSKAKQIITGLTIVVPSSQEFCQSGRSTGMRVVGSTENMEKHIQRSENNIKVAEYDGDDEMEDFSDGESDELISTPVDS